MQNGVNKNNLIMPTAFLFPLYSSTEFLLFCQKAQRLDEYQRLSQAEIDMHLISQALLQAPDFPNKFLN